MVDGTGFPVPKKPSSVVPALLKMTSVDEILQAYGDRNC